MTKRFHTSLQALIYLILTGAALFAVRPGAAEDTMADQRNRLVNLIQLEVRATAQELGFDRLNPEVERALRTVPRERFVPESERALAYINSPLPIGQGQTISQPYIVAIMTQLLGIKAGDRVYELGTGSGYQAAVLAEMGVEVYTVEIVPELAERAAKTLESLGHGDRVQVRAGDGWLGWPEAAPFDGIIVTAAAPRIPRQLVEQLKPNGRLVIPMGPAERTQELVVYTRNEQGDLVRRDILPVRFVPVTGPIAP
ncbi:protein-L-isoaspartate(D-aspartate) O-methyltransferase [Caldichromatium japonicum]|uniref:Protein-L-isoaspartate O-methyltransferase n=1 Tax=Caldichromatium japonicum TaxID=2699430 RepID=A0A6G7VET1_9GAMM|nr:protein-L-isoaspartate(D-aspartate) O-methyltransferase [Caldichromatium japonicum]QIK38410.1 protein-L-isoaspartate(D-aspartate) O-methyltransferase [Caldichromatium japonicum]